MKVFRGDSPNSFLKLQQKVFFRTLAHVIDKNKAKFYFYAESIKYAAEYGSFVSIWNVPSEWKILDLRKDVDCKRIAPYMTNFLSSFYKGKIATLEHELDRNWIWVGGSKGSRKLNKKEVESRKAEIKVNQQAIVDMDKGKFSPTVLQYLASQKTSDFEHGLELKKGLIKIGYHGFCFQESANGLTYGFLNKPNLDLKDWLKNVKNAENLKAEFDINAALNHDYKGLYYEAKINKILKNRKETNLIDATSEYSIWYIKSDNGRFKISIPRNLAIATIDDDSLHFF